MGKDKIVMEALLGDQLLSEPAQACSRIDDDDFVVFCPDLDTGGVAAVLHVFRP